MPVREVALALGCLLDKVFGGFGRFWRVWRVWKVWQFGAFAGGQTAALKAHRKPLLWPWPWGACWGSGLGPGVPAGQGVWRVWTVLESARRVWRVLEGLECFGGCLECLEVLERLEGFGAFGVFAGWQTAALKANSHCCGLGPGVPD